MPSLPTFGKHKDRTYYLRATEPDHAKAIQDAAKGLKVNLEHRKGPGKHEGKTGTFSHFHSQDPEAIKSILEKLKTEPAEGGPGDGSGGEPPAEPRGTHLHIHIHDGEGPGGAPGEEEDEEKPGREIQKAHVEKHTRTLANGRVVSVHAYEDSRQKAMHAGTLAHSAGLHAMRAKTAEAHEHAARMHDEAMQAHKEAHEIHPLDQIDIGADHRNQIEDHSAASTFHRSEADWIRAGKSDEDEEEAPARALAKAHVQAHTRNVNGKLVQVHEHEDHRQGQPKKNPLHADPEHHRSVAEASSLSARVASHEAKDETGHEDARDRHYAAASAHLRAAHAMVVHHGHDTEHPDVKAHLTKAQAHHDKALSHWKSARGSAEKGHQVTLDEAIAEADKREIRKALQQAMGNLLASTQRWNSAGYEPGNRHRSPDDIPEASQALHHLLIADALSASPEEILNTLFMGTGSNTLFQEAMLDMVHEFHEDHRHLAKALHAVRCYNRPDKLGHLQSVTAYVRNVDDAKHEDWKAKAIETTQKKLKALLQAGKEWERKIRAGADPKTLKEPRSTEVSHNVHIGPLACTYGQIKHIIEERTEAHQRDPQKNPPPAEALKHIAKALVEGRPLIDPTSTQARVWLTSEGWQASVAPFWNQTPGAIHATDRSYIVTGFRMEPDRVSRMQGYEANPALQPPITIMTDPIP